MGCEAVINSMLHCATIFCNYLNLWLIDYLRWLVINNRIQVSLFCANYKNFEYGLSLLHSNVAFVMYNLILHLFQQCTIRGRLLYIPHVSIFHFSVLSNWQLLPARLTQSNRMRGRVVRRRHPPQSLQGLSHRLLLSGQCYHIHGHPVSQGSVLSWEHNYCLRVSLPSRHVQQCHNITGYVRLHSLLK